MNTNTPNYLTMSEIHSSALTVPQIQEQITMRRDLLSNLISHLYSSIVQNEIDQLVEIKYDPQLKLL